MTHESDKLKAGERRQRDENAVNRQVRIAKQHGLGFDDEVIREPHRLAKHHAMDCGQPGCVMCGNPRKTHKDKLTAQEKRMYQDTDTVRDRHSNGKKNDSEDLL
jgi:hypothetical protein